LRIKECLPVQLAALSASVLTFAGFSLLVLLTYFLSVCFASELSAELTLLALLTLRSLSVLLAHFLDVSASLRLVLSVCHC
jgi:hypothetical protein